MIGDYYQVNNQYGQERNGSFSSDLLTKSKIIDTVDNYCYNYIRQLIVIKCRKLNVVSN